MHPNVPRPPQPGPAYPAADRGNPVARSNGMNGSTMSALGNAPSDPKPWDLFLLVAAALLLVAQARTHVFIPGASALRPALLLCGLGLGLWAIQKQRIRLPKRLNSPLMKAAWFIPLWALIGVPFAMWQGGAARYIIESLAPTFLVFLIVAASIRNLEDVRRLVGVFALGTALYAFMAPQNPIGRAFRAGGYDANDSAMFLVSGIPPLVFFTLFGRKLWVRGAAGFGTLLALYATVDSSSRGGFIAIVAVLGFMVVMLKGIKPILRTTVVAVVIAASIPVASSDYWDRMQTIQEFDDGYSDGVGGRRNVWSRAMEYTWANPITGVGINNFTVAEGNHPEIRSRIAAGLGTKYSVAHSQWFHVVAELGIPGFIAFTALFLLSLKELRRIQLKSGRSPPRMRRKEVRVMAGILMASLIGLMFAGSFLSNAYSAMIWGPLGIIAGFLKVHGDSAGSTSSAHPNGTAHERHSPRHPSVKISGQ